MDMHARFEAFAGGRWYPFDATQNQPRGGRIVVAYGRDGADVAFLSNYGPLEMGDMRSRWKKSNRARRASVPLHGERHDRHAGGHD